jgi:PleD family two-component response regulator
VQGKLESDRQRADRMIDPASGLYNDTGFARRSAELAAFVVRERLPLSCAVFQPANGAVAMVPVAADRLAQAFKRAGRISDALGRTGTAEFAVFAPATDEVGAHGMVQRLSDAVAKAIQVRLRAGISTAAAPTPATGPPSPPDLLAEARNALR